MISWECSKAENTAEKKSRRRRRSKRERGSQSLEEKDEKDGEENAGSCNEESSSGESEYHSAEDELVNSESESPCLSVFASGSDDESSVSTSSFRTCSNYGWDIPGDDMILDGNFQLKPIVSKRAPSKKQKQKRREEQQKTFFLEDLPFANLQEYDFLGDEISDSVTVQKSVPSLADLCIRATRNLNSATKNLIPRSLNASMSHANEKFYMEKLQLSWLCQILEKVTYREEKSLNISLLTFSYFNKLEEKKFFIPTRNVWTIHFIHQRKSACSFNRDRYGLADIKSFFLPFTHALNYAFLRHFHYDNVTNSSVTSILSGTYYL
ncbi:hypothetical protein FSP39_004570 [Pinctada imbricata]|uniref:Uncharacterized protein n=1 Tax=Pinctada imbricata TaxID=66713 RepID=A0AA89BWV6_PINIB|nr:hypothetical protein FSP39_004570 [Pinctada imbricata]